MKMNWFALNGAGLIRSTEGMLMLVSGTGLSWKMAAKQLLLSFDWKRLVSSWQQDHLDQSASSVD